VSLHNGPKTFVVTGPPKALFGLVTSLRKVRAQSGLDQSKTPFSKRKPVFSIRFLLVGVPYHNEYLDGVTDAVEKDLEDEELWDAKDLKIPVYNTEDGISIFLPSLGAYKLSFVSIGSDMRELKSSITTAPIVHAIIPSRCLTTPLLNLTYCQKSYKDLTLILQLVLCDNLTLCTSDMQDSAPVS
jgi:hypothetical protein